MEKQSHSEKQPLLTLRPIGQVRCEEGAFYLQIDSAYRPALTALEGFGHIAALWWFSDFDQPEARQLLQYPQPYRGAPEVMGVFATRGPVRPNPLALSVCGVLGIDEEGGRIQLDYIDAQDGSPLLDIKPYTPSLDRVERPVTPAWCAHWPGNVESSGDFDWEGEMAY